MLLIPASVLIWSPVQGYYVITYCVCHFLSLSLSLSLFLSLSLSLCMILKKKFQW